MSTSSESAEQTVKLCLEGMEVALRISGVAAKNIAAMLYTISQNKQQTKGKARLNSMLKSEKELKIFSIKRDELKTFYQEAKSYGVLYCALLNKKNKDVDGMVDIMVRAEDAPKVNRIIERFNLSTVDKATIKSEIEKEINQNKETKLENILEIQEEKDVGDTMIDDIFNKPVASKNENPLLAKTEKNPPLEHSSMSKNNSEGVTKPVEKKSVREDLAEIKAELKVETELKKTQKSKSVTKKDKNIAIKREKNKKGKVK